jgi:L-ectoine synthase
MIVRTRKNAEIVKQANWTSERLLLKKDNMGFSFHITTLMANSEIKLHYKNHLESVYCIRGEGSIIDIKNSLEYQINPGTIYALNHNDEHIVKAKTEMELACVFNPPCVGNEKHAKDGSYSISD